jgi:hypothetical protein
MVARRIHTLPNHQNQGVQPEDEDVKLLCFGKLELGGCHSGRVTPQQTLLLCYVMLEGLRPRWELAGLFWTHLAGEFTKKGERKDASNLGVARAILKSELGLDIDDPACLAALESDVGFFRCSLEKNELEAALSVFRRGTFLHEIEHRSRLKLGEDLYQWVLDTRAKLNEAARAALVKLAQTALRAGQLERARALAEEAHGIEQHSGNPETLSKLHQLLLELGSKSAGRASAVLSASLEELRFQLSPSAFRFYLILTLQDPTNLAAAQRAAELGAKAGAESLQELLKVGLTTPDLQVNAEIARYYLREHPAEKMVLLETLRDHTPTDQAYAIYHEIFEIGQNFGGVGYWDRARSS